MKRIEDPRQIRLFELAGDYLSARQRSKLENGMHGLFRRTILQLMPVEKLGSHLSPNHGRPSMELYAACGLILFQGWFGWGDEEAVRRYNYDLSIQYALNVDGSYREISLRTLERYQKKFRTDNLASELFSDVTRVLIAELGIEVQKQRLDSTHVFSNMAQWGRKQLCFNIIKRFLTQMKRHENGLYYKLDAVYLERYEKDAGWIFAEPGIKNTRYRGHICDNLEQLGWDMDRLIAMFGSHQKLSNMTTYKEMVRVFTENFFSDDGKIKISPHPGGAALQNPSDPDAGNGHKGQGYQVQVAETCHDSNPVQIVTCVIPEKANASDQNAVEPVLEQTRENGIQPELLLADTGYGSDDNVRHAEAAGTRLVAPTVAKKDCEFGLEDFKFDENKRLIRCPRNCRPLKSSFKGGNGRAVFAQSACANCPHLKSCPVSKSGKNFAITYTEKSLRLANRRVNQRTAEFKEEYRPRGGIEATFGREKQYGPLRRLRVRGEKAVYSAIYLIWIGHNIMRAARFFENQAQKLRKAPKAASISARRRPNSPIHRLWRHGFVSWAINLRAV